MSPVNVKLISRNLNTNSTQELTFFDVEKAKRWLVNYAEQEEMTRSAGKYWNENECIWIQVETCKS